MDLNSTIGAWISTSNAFQYPIPDEIASILSSFETWTEAPLAPTRGNDPKATTKIDSREMLSRAAQMLFGECDPEKSRAPLYKRLNRMEGSRVVIR